MKMIQAVLAGIFMVSAANIADAKSLHFTKSQFSPGVGSSYYGDQSIYMAAAVPGESEAVLSFILPADYRKNSAAKIEFLFEGGSNNCDYQIDAVHLGRQRLGYDEAFSIETSQSGFGPVAAGPTPAPSEGVYRVFKKTFKLVKPSGLAVTGQRAGDIIIATIVRDSAAVTDNCGTLYLLGGRLIYKTN